MTQALYESSIKSLPLLGRGKVRDIYAVGDDKLLIVTSDRLSAFDVVLPNPIPAKGIVLTQLANFWFDKLAHILPNQLTGIDPESVVNEEEREQVRGRGLVVKRLKPLPIEAVVRGYLIGSGWKDYQQTGAVCGIKLPAGLQLAAKLPAPIFTRRPRPNWANTTRTFPSSRRRSIALPPSPTHSRAPARTARRSPPKRAMPRSPSTARPPISR